MSGSDSTSYSPLFSGELLARAKLAAGLFLFLQNFGFKYPTPLADAWFLPAWSLAVEEQFYLIAPFVIRLVSPRRLFGLIGAVILAAPLLRAWVLYHVPQADASLPLAYTLMPCRADALAVGIMAALLWRKVGFRIWLAAHVKALYLTTAVFLAGFIALRRTLSSGRCLADADHRVYMDRHLVRARDGIGDDQFCWTNRRNCANVLAAGDWPGLLLPVSDP